MAPNRTDIPEIFRTLRWPLVLTRLGMVAERLARSFWPLWSIAIFALALLMLGVQDEVAVEWVWGAAALLGAGAIWAGWYGVRQFRWPSRGAAMLRLDGTLRGNPIQAALDTQAIGGGDASSTAVWRAHQKRMRDRLAEARAVEPDLRVSKNDPLALRYVALLALSVAILFGSLVRVQSVTGMGAGGPDLAQGPAWEGWMQPPAYTRLPSVYLNDITAPEIDVPEGAEITLRMYGEVGALSVRESISGRDLSPEEAQETAQDFAVLKSGELAVDGPGGRVWQIAMIPDAAPAVKRDGEIEVSYEGEAQIPFTASDDHGVVMGKARFTLDLAAVDRRYGRAIEPEPRETIEVPLPMPVAGDRSEFTEALVGNFSLHPWANLPVKLSLEVQDGRGQSGLSEPQSLTMPGRRFFDPVAAALIEQRQALLWNRENAANIAMIFKTILNEPDDLFRKDVEYMRLRALAKRLETLAKYGAITDEKQDELAQKMWDLALEMEEGDLDDARERMERARERLEEAMKNGASDQEIAELMQELREATRDYMRQLGQQQARENPEGQQMNPQDMIEMSQDDIQRMMDRIQELMEQGRMAEAAEAMRQLQEMLDNMQITQGPGGGGQSPGEQAMEGLADTLREQQELSDEAFRDLNNGQRGQGQRQPGQGPQGQDRQPGQGQAGRDPGQGQGGDDPASELAERQRALRDELNRQRQALPGQGTEAGERAAEALERAEGAMDGAERALRDGDLGRAIDQQSRALEALREGMRDLGEALAQQQQQRTGEQGFADGGDPGEQRDPLGRNTGNTGRVGTDEGLLQGQDVYRRAEELLGELRRRSGELDRPEEERNYLDRLLERF
ncbi:DUF4175 domain-containing protein [Mameliella sp. AT18]|uniref:DUF4175 domain-containing protein n=1 Tax=Mameliella sp. AT18 TaxID=3028385 RepID=UPI0008410EDD|nr:DUF4175 domain-containing protein [Mameliella sp. AT18]MDD9733495.1 DUF4175 domain-containing protein [Mameliella sp. AT18]ODM46015.1 ATPase [Ruegeria sp. PBVC088]